MYHRRVDLRIPGPVPVPPEVLQANAKPVINHRGKEFKAWFPGFRQKLQRVFCTEELVIPLTGSGTAAMEAAVSNCVAEGDAVLVLNGGAFGQRWSNICRRYGAEVHEYVYPWGQGADIDYVASYLRDHPEITAVFSTHNESSTAVLNDVEGLGAACRGHQALLVVDAVSSLGGVRLQTDDWGVDVVCTASQKCLMAPPGIALLSLSSQARKRMKQVECRSFYFDLLTYDAMLENGEPPFTPNMSTLFALDTALDMIAAEGLEAVYSRHILARDMMRSGLSALGLALFVEECWASPTVTAVVVDDNLPLDLRQELLGRFGIEIAGGQGKMKHSMYRIGHMGAITPFEVINCLAAVEMLLGKLGVAVAAAEEVWNRVD